MALLEREVPFYKNCRLYRVIDMRGPRSRFASFVLHRESADLAALHTESAPIHDFNRRRHASGELIIDESSVAAYLRFFGEFVQAEEGAFPIIESVKEIRWLSQSNNGRPEPSARSKASQQNVLLKQVFTDALQSVGLYKLRFDPPVLAATPAETEPLQPPRLPESPPQTLFCRASVGYGRYLFAAGFTVSAEGFVEMFGDSPLHSAALPIRPLSFNREFQFILRTDAVQPDEQTRGN
jgi:hypothetical protein